VINALTIDVEEYFHPTEVQSSIGKAEWSSFPSRVEDQVCRILDLLARKEVKATFFILGWVADEHPSIIRRIVEQGHEIGCHSYFHRLVYDLSPKAFREDTRQAVDAIANACGRLAGIYRAPSYSITAQSMWALEILVECGFWCDSSIYPISHDRYGIPNFGRHLQVVQTPSGPIHELPIATVELFKGWVSPVGGGGYFRLLPYSYTAAGIRRINNHERVPACFYLHPWEIDPLQPRLATGRISRWRTYRGLDTMFSKLEHLLEDFEFSAIGTVYPVPQMSSAAATGRSH
jgi:polysaccharide deacetylase family protein (PEP-CTERM system associated)